MEALSIQQIFIFKLSTGGFVKKCEIFVKVGQKLLGLMHYKKLYLFTLRYLPECINTA